MTSAAGETKLQITMLPSFSLYVTAEFRRSPNVERIAQASQFGDSITIAGPKGPEVISTLRASGFEKPVLFDGMGYAGTRKTEPVPIEIPGLGYRPWRVPLQIRYEGRGFGSAALEVAIDETSATHHELIEPDGIALATFAIDPARLVPCLDVPYQIAQKLHACTEPLPEGNDRVRDIIDIWLLEALLDPTDLATVHSAAIETFRRRQNHRWPPVVTSSDSWARDYAVLITEYPDAPPTIDAAVNYLACLVERIDAARPEASDGK